MPRRIGYTTALRTSWYWALLTGLYSSLTLFKSRLFPEHVPSISVTLELAAGFAMGVLLVFRANRAYERWWEARTLWGSLVNVSRNLAVKVERLVHPEHGRDQSRILLVAYCYRLKDHLRGESSIHEIPGMGPGVDRPQHIPSFIVAQIYELFAQWRQQGQMSDAELWVLDREARMLLDICGACERIKNTLMSVSWRVFTRQIIFLYLLVFPWGLVDDFGILTIPISVLLAYIAFGSEGISTYVEEPFGQSEDHLDLDSLCQLIEATVNEIYQYHPDV